MQTQHHHQETPLLYRLVFKAVFVKYLIAFLFAFFLLHPVMPVFAAEEEVTEDTGVVEEEVVEKVIAEVEVETDELEEEPEVVEEEIVAESESETTDTEQDEADETAEEAVDEENAQLPEDEQADQSLVDTSLEPESVTVPEEIDSDQDSEVATSTDIEIVPETEPDNASTTNEVSTTTATGSSDGDSGAQSIEAGTSTDGVVGTSTDPVATTTETTVPESASPVSTEPTQDEVLEGSDKVSVENSTTTDVSTIATTTATSTPKKTASTSVRYVEYRPADDQLQFAEQNCRAVGGGSYYCTEITPTSTLMEDMVYAAPDEDGDMEIFVRLDEVDHRITDNDVDDSAPHYDPLSNRIVWHSLIDDRYQIVAYDVETEETLQLTDTSYNNMQPMAHGDMVFWQAWIEDNWEIVRLEGNEIIQMTDNEVHDISPYAQDIYVMWQTQNGDEWQTSLFDITSGQHEFVDADTNGITKNPRLVLMYETYDANGDIKVLGYDLKSKQYINLASVPTSLPEDLPEPSGDSEERALIQTKPSVRAEDESTESDPIATPPIVPPSGASTSEHTLDVSIGTTTATEVGTSTPSDLVIPPLAEVEPQSESDTETDLIIPPLATSSDDVVE